MSPKQVQKAVAKVVARKPELPPDHRSHAEKVKDRTDKLKADLDAILDDIDEVLTETDVVAAAHYLQHGGQ